jgi:hypothetical protein
VSNLLRKNDKRYINKLKPFPKDTFFTQSPVRKPKADIGKPKLKLTESDKFSAFNPTSAYECISIESDSDISQLDKEQTHKLTNFFKSRNKFVEKKTVTYCLSPEKRSEKFKNYTPNTDRKYNKVHKFFNNVYQESKEKTAKQVKTKPMINTISNSGLYKFKYSILDFKDGSASSPRGYVHLPKLKYK